MIFATSWVKVDSLVFQDIGYKYVRHLSDFQMPPLLLEFPWMVEGLPEWIAFAGLGTMIGRELGRYFIRAVRQYKPENKNATYLRQTFRVRYFGNSLTSEISRVACLFVERNFDCGYASNR